VRDYTVGRVTLLERLVLKKSSNESKIPTFMVES